MPKTNEEIKKVLEKNYQTVQVAELHVYDKNAELKKQYKKEAKELDTKLQKDLNSITQEEVDLGTAFRKQEVELSQAESMLQKKLDEKIEVAKSSYEATIKEICALHETEVKKFNNEIKVVKSDSDKLVADVLKEYNKSVEVSKKAVVSINEKCEKDQHTFATKIEDLKVKHELKTEELKTKETTKIQKLTEAADKQVLKLQEAFNAAKEKHAKRLAQLKPVYEEELEEIDENSGSKKDEFDTKYESIRSSADQRISVREKHLQRAIDDGDQRSVKQHRKDIDKFRKEAERDLALLSKTYKSDIEQAVVYRKNYISENLEKLSKIEKEHNTVLEQNKKDVDDVKIMLAFDVKHTNLDYEKLHAEALVAYNQAYAEVKNKEEEVLKQKELDLNKEEASQKKLLIDFNMTNLVNEEIKTEALEQKETFIRLEGIKKSNSETEAKDVLDIEEATLNNEKQLAKFELEKELELILKSELTDSYNQEHKVLSTNKEEFLAYQSLLLPIYKTRVNEIFTYEEQEIENRYKLKIAFLEKQIESLHNNYEIVVEKINNVLVVERAPFDELINNIAGEQTAELNSFEEAHQEKVKVLEDKITPLTQRRDKKTRKLYEDELEEMNSKFVNEKQAKEKQIASSVGMYQQALNAAVARNAQALKDAEDFNQSEDLRLKESIDILKANNTKELEDAKLRLAQSESNLQDFATKAASRNTSNTEDNQSYHDQKLAVVTAQIDQINVDYTQLLENTNKQFNSLLAEYASQKSIVLSTLKEEQNKVESSFEAFKQNIAATIEKHKNDAISKTTLETNNTNDIAATITKKYDDIIQTNNAELTKQTTEYNAHLVEIGKKATSNSVALDDEKKRVQKDFETNLKSVLAEISKKLNEDIAAL